MEEQHLKKLIKKYLDGTATAAEQYIVEAWLESFQQDLDEVSDSNAAQNGELLADRIITKTLQYNPKKPLPLWKIVASSAALILLLPTLVFVYLNINRKADQQLPLTFDRYATGLNESKRILLPDSSIVYLNANSSIRIPRVFNAQKERIVLLNGEAFFEVKKNSKRPFKIQVNQLQVKVLGTSFNIKAYNELKDVKIAVATGKVMVSKDTKSLGSLLPNQELIYNKVTQTYYTNLTMNKEYSWKTGAIVLDKASFDEVSVAFYNIYGNRLVSSDEKTLSERYNLTIRSSRSELQTLNQLCEILNKKYRKEGDSVIIF